MRYFFLLCLLTAGAWGADLDESARRLLTPERLLPAMQEALAGVDAQVEIIETSLYPAPDGEVEFSLRDLNPPPVPGAPTRWRGYIRYGTDKRFSIWAMVKVSGECHRVAAVDRLDAGQPILPAQVREETYGCFPLAKDASWAVSDVVGRAPLRPIREGAAVAPSLTVEPVLIARGAELIAEYRSGGLVLRLPVISEAPGRLGQTIMVRNATSKKQFEARVDGPGLVVVERIP